MRKAVLLLFVIATILPLYAYIGVTDDGNYSATVNNTTIILKKDMDTVFSYPEIKERVSGKILRVPTIEELKSIFNDLKNNNFDTSNVNLFSISFALGFFTGMYDYDSCYFIVTKDGSIGTVQVSSNSYKLNEKTFVVLDDPYYRCPPSILWRIIE